MLRRGCAFKGARVPPMVQNQVQEKHQYQNSAKGHRNRPAGRGINLILKITPKADTSVTIVQPTARSKDKMRMCGTFKDMCVVRRSLGRIGCGVKQLNVSIAPLK
jgi:hypothetical protein